MHMSKPVQRCLMSLTNHIHPDLNGFMAYRLLVSRADYMKRTSKIPVQELLE